MGILEVEVKEQSNCRIMTLEEKEKWFNLGFDEGYSSPMGIGNELIPIEKYNDRRKENFNEVIMNIPTKEENPKGLHQRYIVSKADGTPTGDNVEYFVLRLDKNGKDRNHVNACRKAVLKYADAIEDHLPELANDLVNRYFQKQ